MNFELADEQNQLVDMFRKFFSQESSMDRVRAAEPLGFDRDLYRQLGDMGALSIRLPDSGFTLLDAGLVLEEAGRMLASAPLAEAMVAIRLLAASGDEAAGELAASAAEGATVVTLA
ncbi:MAG TPA: acyl-CoA dehydrogenase family protein, partial [Novosphingobium sp.]|nr:acyl-CoA dehydrogenase family protein [Novosphingobium sp.]